MEKSFPKTLQKLLYGGFPWACSTGIGGWKIGRRSTRRSDGPKYPGPSQAGPSARHRGPGYAKFRSECLCPQHQVKRPSPESVGPTTASALLDLCPARHMEGQAKKKLSRRAAEGGRGWFRRGKGGYPPSPDRTNFFQHFFFRQKKCEKEDSFLEEKQLRNRPRK